MRRFRSTTGAAVRVVDDRLVGVALITFGGVNWELKALRVLWLGTHRGLQCGYGVLFASGVDGTMHSAYDSFPNPTYVIGTDGTVAHRADWPDIDRLSDERERLLTHGRRGGDVLPTTLEEDYHKPNVELFRTTLRVNGRAGAGSLRDLLVAGPRMMAYRLASGVRYLTDV